MRGPPQSPVYKTELSRIENDNREKVCQNKLLNGWSETGKINGPRIESIHRDHNGYDRLQLLPSVARAQRQGPTLRNFHLPSTTYRCFDERAKRVADVEVVVLG